MFHITYIVVNNYIFITQAAALNTPLKIVYSFSLLQPYDLKEFHVVYSVNGESENVQFSSLGLEHMRTVLAMVNMGTQPILPPACHPSQTKGNKTHPYTHEDYKRDIEIRASFFNSDKVVITPAFPPPHPSKFAALLAKPETADVNDAEKKTNLEEGSDKEGHRGGREEAERGGSTVLESAGSSPCLSSPSSLTAAAVLKDHVPGSTLEDKGHLRKSPSLCPSDISVDGSVHDLSLTSYQVPVGHEHSTPVVRGVAKDNVGRDEQEEEEHSLTPVKKDEKPSKPRLLVSSMS